MANTYDKKSKIKNGDTLARRAWIESALASVRDHLDASAFLPSTVESLGHEASHDAVQAGREVSEHRPVQPNLRLVWSAERDRRRSGT